MQPKYNRFYTYEQQIEKLKIKKLIIRDEEFVKFKLQEIGYFSLILGYKNIFKDKNTKDYITGTTFEDILGLYTFDEELRALFLKYILKVERAIKSQYSYSFCKTYGDSQNEYFNVNNYNYQKYQEDINELVGILKDIATNIDSNYNYIKHNIKKYGNVPLWVLINALTLGNISKMYEFSLASLKSQIARAYKNIYGSDLSAMLSVLSKFRNVCAHNERLYNYKTKKSITDLSVHKELKINKKGKQYRFGKNDLFSVVISFRYLLPKDVFDEFFRELVCLIEKYRKIINEKYFVKIFDNMGFVDNWKDIKNFNV